MKQSITLKSFLVVVFVLSGLNMQSQVKKQVDVVTAGTISTFITPEEKDLITNLTVTGPLNGTDIGFISAMAGRDANGKQTLGKLSVLDMSGADIVAGGDYYMSLSDHFFYSSDSTLGQYMFSGTNLTSFKLPNSLTTIANNGFYSISKIATIVIPKNVTSIGSLAFDFLSKLTQIVVSADNSSYCSVNGVLFNKDKTELIRYPLYKKGSYTIPNSVTIICTYAFNMCQQLTSVTIPNSVTTIGEKAFSTCTGLTSITIPNSVTSISQTTFFYCSRLTSVTIPNSITSIGRSAFSGCLSLPSVTIPNSVTSIDTLAFNYCKKLASVTIGTNVTSIGKGAFIDCIVLNEIHNKNITPQAIDSTVFLKLDKSGMTLYVPIEAKAAYQAANEWKDFGTIVEEGITSTSQLKADVVKVYTEGETIIVEGIQSGEAISIYTQAGAIIQTIKATDDRVKIELSLPAIYLIKVGDQTFKVAL